MAGNLFFTRLHNIFVVCFEGVRNCLLNAHAKESLPGSQAMSAQRGPKHTPSKHD